MLRVMKLKKSDYSNLESLLKRAGLVDKKLNRAYPENILISKEDSKKFKKQILNKLKKEHPIISTERLEMSAAMLWLNLGPSEGAADAVRPGFAIILDRSDDE